VPRKSNTEDRRAEIVAAMLTVIAASGYDRATIQQIAKQAGLAPGWSTITSRTSTRFSSRWRNI